MKQFLNALGGHPLTLDDLNHVQSAYQETNDVIIRSMVGDTITGFTCFGGVVTGDLLAGATWTAGWIYVNNELFRFDAQTTTVDSTTHGFYIDEIGDANDPTIYENGSPVNVRVERKLTVKDQATFGTPDVSLLLLAIRLNDTIADDLVSNASLKTKLITDGLPNALETDGWKNLSLGTDWSSITVPQYKKVGDRIFFKGTIEGGASFGTTILSGIDPADRPASDTVLPIDHLSAVSQGQTITRIHVSITTGGDITLNTTKYPQPAGGFRIYLNGAVQNY